MEMKYDIESGTFTVVTNNYVKMACDMEFALYPFDTQECSLVMMSDQGVSGGMIHQGGTSIHKKIVNQSTAAGHNLAPGHRLATTGCLTVTVSF